METFGVRRVSVPSIPPSHIFSSDTERLAFSRTLGGIVSPSDCVKSSAAIKETVSDRYGPPIALFDHALALL